MVTLSQVRRDHANMLRLLHILLRRQKILEHGERPDFRVIREVVDYILDYMNGFIKPLKHIYSEHLLAKEPGADEVSHRLAKDYQALNKRLKQLSQNLDMILMDAVVPMDRFTADLKSYLDAHFAYLRDEREQLLPLFRKHLSLEEQQQLLQLMPEGAADNLARLQQEYPQLYAEFKEAPWTLRDS